MKSLFITTVALLLSLPLAAGTSMKIEGTCTGKLLNGKAVSFTYYSNFDGCQSTSQAAVSFNKGFEGLFTGTRSFTDTQDIYKLNSGFKLIFANSTGNTSGTLFYPLKKKIKVQCEVRDYEYGDC